MSRNCQHQNSNEAYKCNTCKIGKVRPIQFSLKQAIINCDNLDCDSYLEKWPWECIITRPILDSSDLCKYEKDSTCSSDSSGVHSDLGSSGVSQYSVTDREVETLLQKSCTSDFEFESAFKDKKHNFMQWQSGTSIQEQEPFMALDDKCMLLNDMPSHSNKKYTENKLDNILVNNFEKHDSIYDKKQEDFYMYQKGGGRESSNNNTSREENHRTNLDNDLESWLIKLEPSALLEDTNGNSFDNTAELGNGDSSFISPSKALIPSLNSAFSEVSPSKLNLFSNQTTNFCQQSIKERDNDIDVKHKYSKEASIPNVFLSPASSGFNEEYCGDNTNCKPLPTTKREPLDPESELSFEGVKDNFHLLVDPQTKDVSPNKCLPTEFSNSEYDLSVPKNKEENFKALVTEDALYDETTPNTGYPLPELPLLENIQEISKPLETSVIKENDVQEISKHLETSVIKENDVHSPILTTPSSFPPESEELVLEKKINSGSLIPETADNVATQSQIVKISSLKRENDTARNKTKSKNRGIVTDPWSVPEMYIDELNIEVVLKNEPTLPSRSELKKSNSAQLKTGSSNLVALDIEKSSTLDGCDNSNSSQVSSTECDDNQSLFTVCNSPHSINPASQLVDLYKPFTLQPELIDSHEYFDATATSHFSHSPKLRLSVGYGKEDAYNDSSSSSNSKQEPDAKKSNSSSKYFSSLLSDMDFDENFCRLERKDKESSLEDFVSSKFFSSDSESERPVFRNRCSNSKAKDVSLNIVKKEIEEEDEDCKSFLSEGIKAEDESDSEIPVVMIDDNDDLKIFIPVKKEIKEENYAWNSNIIPVQNYSRTKSHVRRNSTNSEFSIATSSIHCQMPENTYKNKNVSNVLDLQNHLYSDPANYSVTTDSFTMFHDHDKFGTLNKEPEFFESFLTDHESDISNNSFEERYLPIGFLHTEDEDWLNKKKQKEKNTKTTPLKCSCKLLFRNRTYMHQIIDPCNCDKTSNSLFDTTLGNSPFDTTFAKPFNNLPSKKNHKKQNLKNSRSNKSSIKSSVSLGKNPSVPDVVNLLKESGWIVTPCNPIINYNVPEHTTSPTVVPVALESQYGNMSSDVVFWSLTDKEVSVKDMENHSKKNKDKSLHEILLKNKKEQYNAKNFNSSKRKFLKKFNRVYSDENTFSSIESTYKKIKLEEAKIDPFEKSNNSNLFSKSGLKRIRTNGGAAAYMQPSIKKEVTTDSDYEMESEKSIELPDDYHAYQEAIKCGYNVSAPPEQPQTIFIPPPSSARLQKHKRGRKITKENLKPFNSNYSKALKREESIETKAQNELKAIVSERPPNEVPDVVCVNVEGKLYVYHRKGS